MEESCGLIPMWNRGELSARILRMKERMYAPQAFRVEDRKRLQDFIARYGFGLLLSDHESGEKQHSWLPFLLSESGEFLEGHLARANPQWQSWRERATVSVHFLGPHAYISPNAYPPGPSVPTWNYAAVRVDGQIAVVHEDAARLEIVSRMVEANEKTQAQPWEFEPNSEFSQGLLKAIVCFRIRIESIFGNFKMSQNKSSETREQVMEYLRQSGGLSEQSCASFMEDSAICFQTEDG